MTFARETLIFLYACLLGAGCGVLYDLFRLLRLLLPSGKISAFLEDFFFCAACALATFFFSLYFCSGRVRIFVLFGETMGFILYLATVGQVVYRLMRWIIGLVFRILKKVFAVILFPFRKILGKLSQLFSKLSMRIKQCFENTYQNKKFFLQRGRHLLYNISISSASCDEGGVKKDEDEIEEKSS